MNKLKKLISEPLVHFLCIGTGLFLLYSFMNGPVIEKPDRIVVTAGQVEQLVGNFSRTWMRPPTAAEMKALVDSYIRDEVYYREAVALGLDKDDKVIRRRLRQKLGFLFEDMAALKGPTEAELTTFMHQQTDHFRLEPQISFRQVYLNPDKRVDLEADARRLLAELKAGATPAELGDQRTGPDEFVLATRSEIERNFGAAFSQQVVKLKPGTWAGPVYSGLGGHLVFVSERIAGRMPELAEVRTRVERDWQVQQRSDLEDSTYRTLLESYEVVIEEAALTTLATAAAPPAAPRVTR